MKSSNGSSSIAVERLRRYDLWWVVQELRELPKQSEFFADVPDDPDYVENYLETLMAENMLKGVCNYDKKSFLLFTEVRPWYANRIEIHEMILWVPERFRGARTAYELIREFTSMALDLHPHSIHAGHTLDITEKERTLRLYEKAGYSRHQGGVILRP